MKKHPPIIKLILLTLLALALVIILNGHYFKSPNDLKDYDNNNWMSYIKDETLLCEIVIPGSHDAGSCSMNWLGRTQGYPIKDQLSMGARYFDLRVNKAEDGYYMYHAMFNGEKFEDVLSALTEFICTNDSETLILDFQHFKGGSERDVLSMVETAFVKEGLAIINDSDKSDLEFISTLQLKDARGKCIILFGGSEELVKESGFLFNRNNDECTKTGMVLNSCYIGEYNKMDSVSYIQKALPYYYQNMEEKIQEEKFKGLFVLQGQLTDGALIFGPYSKEKTHDQNMTDYILGLKEDTAKLSLTNIIMRDFLTTEKCENIISLNYDKGNVKE